MAEPSVWDLLRNMTGFDMLSYGAKGAHMLAQNAAGLRPEQQEQKDQPRLPQVASAPESPSYGAGDVYPPPAQPSVGGMLYGTPQSAPESTAVTQAAPVAPSAPSAPSAPQGDSGQDFRKFLLQTGLSLMAGGWGNPASQIGQAIGSGVEAVDRAVEQQTEREQQKANLAFKRRQLDIQQQNAESSRVRARASLESARSKRLRSTDAEDEVTSGMSPEAKSYFQNRMKGFNKALEPTELDGPAPDPQNVYDQILNETRAVDLRARLSRGELKATEIPETDIQAAVQDPSRESALINAVRSDPIQVNLIRKRLEAARGQSDATR